jgi:hypothetical protein
MEEVNEDLPSLRWTLRKILARTILFESGARSDNFTPPFHLIYGLEDELFEISSILTIYQLV